MKALTERRGFPSLLDEEVRRLWAEALNGVRESSPFVTMIHLDSLLWQAAKLSRGNLAGLFASLGTPETGSEFLGLLA